MYNYSKEFKKEVLDWYKDFSIHQKIFLKSKGFKLLCGEEWADLSFLLDTKDRLCVFYSKWYKTND